MATPALAALLGFALLWRACELVMRAWIEGPLARDFYGSIPRESVREHRERHGLRVATTRGRYDSRVDWYQSFDLEHWQYARSALRTGRGCEQGPGRRESDRWIEPLHERV